MMFIRISDIVYRPCKTKKVKCGEERPRCLNCEKQGEPCDYSIRLNWEGRAQRKASERNPEPGQWLSAAKHEDLVQPAPVKCQPGIAGTGQSVVAPGTASVLNLISFGPDSGKPKEEYIGAGMKIEIDDASPLDPSVSQNAINPLDSSANSFDSESSPSQNTLPSKRISYTPVFQSPIHLAHNTDHRENVLRHRGPSQKQTMEVGSNDSRLLKRPRTDPPPFLELSNQNSDHGYFQSPLVSGFPQMSPLPTGSTRYSSGDSTTVVPPSPSSATSILSNNTSAGGSLRSVASSVPLTLGTPTDTRRLSVNALLSSPITTGFASPSKVYGINKGFPDLDIPHNKDTNALDSASPLSDRHTISDASGNCNESPLAEFGFGLYGKTVLLSGNEFYASPILVEVESNLEPLPAMLLDNQMNLLYFHHFINHTARVLVPHDCPENPFRTILPQSRLQNRQIHCF